MSNNSYLVHWGIKGQKWGTRRWQNEDGSLTPEGYIHYGYDPSGRRKVGFNGQLSKSTQERAKQGSKIGLKAGVGVGALSTALGVAKEARILSAIGYNVAVNPATIAAAGAVIIGTYAVSGYLHGAAYGAIAGAIEQRQGEKYINSRLNDSYNSKEIHANMKSEMNKINKSL